MWKRLITGFEGPVLFPVFCAVYITYRYLVHLDLELTGLPREMIGISTLKGIDIGKRANVLYEALFILTTIWLFVSAGINFLYYKYMRFLPPHRVLNGISAFGILLIFGAFFTPGVTESLNVILSVLAVAILFYAIGTFQNSEVPRNEDVLALTLLTAASLAILFRDVSIHFFSYTGYFYFNDLLLLFGSIWCLIRLGISLISPTRTGFLNLISFLLIHIPLISFISYEITMIMEQRGFEPLTVSASLLVTLIGVFGLALIIEKRFPKPLDDRWLNYVAVVFITGLLLFLYYTPVIEHSEEMFELANPALGIHRYFTYGEIPVLESFNSHMFFELWYGFIYSFLNGYHGLDFRTYSFLNPVLSALVIYFFLRRWGMNRWMVIAVHLLFPMILFILPFTLATVLIVIMLMDQWYKRQDFRTYLWLMVSLMALVVWRIDLGFAGIFVTGILLGIFFIQGLARVRANHIFVPILLITAIIVVTMSYSVFHEIPIWDNFQQALYYLSSQQSYGLPELAPSYNNVFFAQHFMFPVAIFVLLLYLLFNLQSLLKRNRFITISMLSMIVFYLINFHRGIVRHGFIENSDNWLSSFAFFILPASIYFMELNDRWKPYRSYLFLALSFVILVAFKYPDIRISDSQYSRLYDRFLKADSTWEEGKIVGTRISGSEDFYRKKIDEIGSFFNQFLGEGENFYDYSNSPMLYYYLEKRPPSYFNQMLLSIHDSFLNQIVIDTLKNGKFPFIVYSAFPEAGLDQLDGVPKDLRHFSLGEHIHRNFKPFAIVGDFVIWKNNSITSSLRSLSPGFQLDTLKKNRLVLNIADSALKYNKIEVSVPSDKYTFLTIGDTAIYQSYSAGGYNYFLMEKDLILKGKVLIHGAIDEINSVEVTNTDYFPDHYSDRSKKYNLELLPAIWAGDYDKGDFDIRNLEEVENDSIPGFHFIIPDHIDKSKGNFILVECHTVWDKYDGFELSFTAAGEKLGSFDFIADETPENPYLIRVSSQFLWNRDDIDGITISPEYYMSQVKNAYLLTPK